MKEIQFLSYNKDNIMKHLLAIEDHARNLESGMKPEHYACITKHALQVEEQAEEGISHASIAEPGKVGIFESIRMQIKEFRDKLKDDSKPETAIREIRRIRKEAEKLNPEYNISECRICDTIKRFLGREKGLNTPSGQELNIKKGGHMERDLIVNAAIGSAVSKGVSVVTPMAITGSTAGIANKTIANVLIGAGLSAASLYGKLPGRMGFIGAVAGTGLIVSELIDLAVGMIPPAPVAAPPAPAPVAISNFGGGGRALYHTTLGTTVGQNGAMVYID